MNELLLYMQCSIHSTVEDMFVSSPVKDTCAHKSQSLIHKLLDLVYVWDGVVDETIMLKGAMMESFIF